VRPAPAILRAFHHGQFDAGGLAAAKGATTVAVCLPARNEETTVGPIVDTIRRALVETTGLVDDLVVVDDHSTDRTAARAEAAGARVVTAADVLAGHGGARGKGAAMWTSLLETDADIVAWCDADVVGFEAHFVVGLLGPLLTRPELDFVKGFYDRPAASPGERGGRVTELVARPLLSILFPPLASVIQPLAGEYAGRRRVLEHLSFVEGYGVDVGLLIDVAARFGTDVMAQVDLGTRIHRNRPLDELSPQATAIHQTVLGRAGVVVPPSATLVRPGLDPIEIEVAELPPLVTVPGYRQVARGA
jgi:glucosyl-3-phosphoglycerate synthase